MSTFWCSLTQDQMELGLLSGDQLVPGRGRISEEPDIREEMPSLECVTSGLTTGWSKSLVPIHEETRGGFLYPPT